MDLKRNISTDLTETNAKMRKLLIDRKNKDVGNDKNDISDVNDKCYTSTICKTLFTDLQSSLRHELLQHMISSSTKRSRKKFNDLVKLFTDKRKTEEYERLHEVLSEISDGDVRTIMCNQQAEYSSAALNAVFTEYCAKDINLISGLICNALISALTKFMSLPQIYLIGSLVNGLALKDSDLDAFICCGGSSTGLYSSQQAAGYNLIFQSLGRSAEFTEIVSIPDSFGPIIKCKHVTTKVSIDINCSNPGSIWNSAFLRDILKWDRRLQGMMLFLKIWAKNVQIIGHTNFRSYSFSMLVIFYLQQPFEYNGMQPLVPSIEQMQRHANPNYIEGVNYGYCLQNTMRPLAADLETVTLIKGFFKFFMKFEMTKFMMCPYLGQAIPLADIRSGVFKNGAYDMFMEHLHKYAKTSDQPVPKTLDIGGCVILQDPFQQNVNVARAIHLVDIRYFQDFIRCADKLCRQATDEQKSEAWLYEALLFGIVRDLIALVPLDAPSLPDQNITSNEQNCNPLVSSGLRELNVLYDRLTPSRAEFKILRMCRLGFNIFDEWHRLYQEIVIDIITQIYKIDMKPIEIDTLDKKIRNANARGASSSTSTSNSLTASDGNNSNNSNNNSITHITHAEDDSKEMHWYMHTNINTWVDRTFSKQKGKMNFMEMQLKQTEVFVKSNSQRPDLKVDFTATLTLKYSPKIPALDIIVKKHPYNLSVITKKDPLHKFFGSLKFAVKCFNLKEKLLHDKHISN